MKGFKAKVQSMTAKEIIMAMVEGLQKPVTEIKMSSYGNVEGGDCYGCAATNTICKIMEFDTSMATKLLKDAYLPGFSNASDENEEEFVEIFEGAIDDLRMGRIYYYNLMAKDIEIATIKEPDFKLPYLQDEYTQEELDKYIELANAQ